MSDQDVLAGYVEVWWQAIDDFTLLLEELDDDQWPLPTDLAGWDVRAVASHTAHLESVLATAVEESAEVDQAPHIVSPMGLYTEIGVLNRRTEAPDVIINQIREAATTRHTALLADPPTDADGTPTYVFGGVPWTWGTLLRNRPLDVWMHEQDVRRATGRPGGMDTAPAEHTIGHLADGFGFVLAKKAGAPAGTTAVLAVEGVDPVAFTVGEDGRGRRIELPADPSVDLRLTMDRETFICLAGGRRAATPGAVRIDGDTELAQRVIEAMATTP